MFCRAVVLNYYVLTLLDETKTTQDFARSAFLDSVNAETPRNVDDRRLLTSLVFLNAHSAYFQLALECLLLHAGQVRAVPQGAAARQSPRALQRAPRSSQVSRPERVLFVVIFHLKEPKFLIFDQGRYYRSQAQEESKTSNKENITNLTST